jgi:hypothetical protein
MNRLRFCGYSILAILTLAPWIVLSIGQPDRPNRGNRFSLLMTGFEIPAKADAPSLNGLWSSGFKFLPVPELNVGAFANFIVNITATQTSLRIQTGGEVFGSLTQGNNSAYEDEIVSVRKVEPQPAGKDGIIPDELYILTTRIKDVRIILLDPQEAAKATRKKRCGISNWVPGQEVSVFNTRCVKGNKNATGESPLAIYKGRLIVPLTGLDDGSGPDSASPPDDNDPDDGFSIDLDEGPPPSIKDLNFDVTLKKLVTPVR